MNALALIEEILVRARQEGTLDTVIDGLHGLARRLGIPEVTILECLADDGQYVVYQP